MPFLWKFKEDCLKTKGYKFLMKWSFFAFLVCAFNKEPVVASDFDSLYLKNNFEFFQVVKNVW